MLNTKNLNEDFDHKAINIGKEIIRQDIDTLQNLSTSLDQSFVEAATKVCNCQGLVWITAVGTSTAVGTRFAHILTCSGKRSMFLSPSDGLHGHTNILRKKDLLIAISRGGESREVIQMVEIANDLGTETLAFVSNPDSRLAEISKLTLLIPCKQEYELMGYLATTSTIAYSAICDALCAIVASKKGFSPKTFAKIHPGGAVGKTLNP
jgi:arabinose-5-phosphate isomerase